MWLRGVKFCAQVVKAGEIVEFTPIDPSGKPRTQGVVRLHNRNAARIAGTWLPTDRVFYYHEGAEGNSEGGFFNERTNEKIPVP